MAYTSNVRECKLCHRMVDFEDPTNAHETMEESAWLDIRERQHVAAKAGEFNVINEAVKQVAEELGTCAAKDFHEVLQRIYDTEDETWIPVAKAKHLSDLDHVYQHRSQK